MSERHACRLLELSRSTYRYRVRNPERDKDLRARLKELAARRMRFGYRRLTVMLAREGIPANHKRVYRLYREEGDAHTTTAADSVEWPGGATSGGASESAMVDRFCQRLGEWQQSDSDLDL